MVELSNFSRSGAPVTDPAPAAKKKDGSIHN